MPGKIKLISIIVVFVLAGGVYMYQKSTAPKQENAKSETHDHAKTESDGHAHEDSHAHSDSKESEGHGHDHAGSGGHGEEGGHSEESKISDKSAEKLNIEVSKASSGAVQETISVTGRITLNQNTSSQVKARFTGIIRSMAREAGEMVKAGETLATVESNESLQVYPVKAPISGTIITRNGSMGDTTTDTPLFVIADLKTVWAELFIFSKDSEKLKPGQTLRVYSLDNASTSESLISLISPNAEASSQTLVARGVVENANYQWRSGMNIRADIVVSSKQVPLVVRTEAIQRMEGNSVVFVQDEPGTYKAQPIKTGMSDPQWTEVKEGLKVGQQYVSKNSFVVKADIGKAGAAHEH